MEKNFTQIPNEILDNKELSLEQKAILAIFYRNSDEWKVYQSELMTRSSCGRDKHVRVLKELASLGYIEKVVDGDLRDKSTGKFSKGETYWKLVKTTVDWIPVTGNQQPVSSNWLPASNNTNENNTNEIKQKEIINSSSVDSNIITQVNKKEEAEFRHLKVEGKKYFFQLNEKPSFQKIEEFYHSNGYSSKQALEMHKKLIDSGYKDSSGNNIKFLDSYIKKEMSKIKPDLSNEDVDQLTLSVYQIIAPSFEQEELEYRFYTIQLDSKEYVQKLISKYGLQKAEKIINWIISKGYTFKSTSQIDAYIQEESKKAAKNNS